MSDNLSSAVPAKGVVPKRLRWWRCTAVTIGILVGLLLAECVARIMFTSGPARSLEPLRAALAGELLPEAAFQRSIPQPYLLYSPAPGHRGSTGEVDHNMQGYRGWPVQLAKTPGITRILCLGGSTTYGWGVSSAQDAYPAQLMEILNEGPPGGGQGYEVINAGLPFGTSAELLTHYHFKFHYYRPDIVIIHTGGNDALAVDRGHYHPDYSHWRRPMTMPAPWGPGGRRLLQSRLAALALLPLVGGAPRGSQTLERPADTPPESSWFPSERSDRPAFRHNIESLVKLVRADNAVALLVPFRLEPRHALTADEAAQIDHHARILEEIARHHAIPLAAFPASMIPREDWVDDCHLTPEGCRKKAAYLAPRVRKLAEGKSVDD